MSKNFDLPHVPGENPFIVARGGFYRRWLQMIDNLDEFGGVVAKLETTCNMIGCLSGEKLEENMKI